MGVDQRDISKLGNLLSLDLEVNFRTLEYVTRNIDILHNLDNAIKRVIIDTEQLTVEICSENLAKNITETIALDVQLENATGRYKLKIPYHTKRAHRGAVMIRSGNGKDPLDLPKARLENLVQGIIWRDEHFAGTSFQDIAKKNGCSKAQVSKLIHQSLDIA